MREIEYCVNKIDKQLHMRKIVFATNNKHKLDEIREITRGKIEILSLSDIDCHDDIPETGVTFEENALLKAQYVKSKYGLDCFADDSGLEVDALNGEPGVYTSRFAGDNATSEDNMVKLLDELKYKDNRGARFRTVIALIENGSHHYFNGTIEGKISETKQGEGGFGYDPIFIPNGYIETFAELGVDVKNNISHRAIATRGLVDFLINGK